MHNWRQSPAALIVSVLLLLVWVAIHLATFAEFAATWLHDWSSWILLLLGLSAFGNLLFAPFMNAGKRQQKPPSDRNRHWQLWPITPRALVLWLVLAYLILLFYLSIFAPNVDTKQQEIYRLRYWSALGVYVVCTWLPGIFMQRRKQAGEGPPAART